MGEGGLISLPFLENHKVGYVTFKNHVEKGWF